MQENIKQFNNQPEKSEKIEEIIESFYKRFPIIAKDLIKKNQDLSDEKNKKFLDNPDDPSQHEPRWHQWGIITHTKMFEKAYNEETLKYLEQWGIYNEVQNQMSEEIDSVSKDQLLRIAILFHDLGKFTTRKIKEKLFSFKEHEIASGEIIRSSEFSAMLKQEYNLTDAQIEYIAQCAELHYVFGVIRDQAKKSNGYNFAFIQSDEFKEQIKQILTQYPNFQLEIGLLFLADTLGKTDIRIEGKDDEEIESQEAAINKILEVKGLDPNFINGIKQLPVTCAIMEIYLKMWASQNK